MINKVREQGSLADFIKLLQSQGVPSSQYERLVGRFLDNKARQNRIPLIGLFELTPLCNFDCKMCYVHLSKGQFDPSKLISQDDWVTLMLQACECGMRYAKLSGGECLTYPHFDYLYRLLAQHHVSISVATNGSLISKSTLKLFSMYKPSVIQITLYGSTEAVYEKVTGFRSCETVINNIALLRQAKLPVRIAITPNQFSIDDVKNQIKLAESLDVPYNINTQLIQPRPGTGRSVQDISVEQYIDIIKSQARYRSTDFTPIDYCALPPAGINGEVSRGLRCGAGRNSFAVLYDGRMTPCDAIHDLDIRPLEVGFREGWNQVVRFADDYEMPLECTNCFYKSRCSSCVAKHFNAPIAGHCDPHVCERTKKFISSGLISKPID